MTWASDMQLDAINAIDFSLQDLLEPPPAIVLQCEDDPPPQQKMPLSLGLKP